MDGRKYPVGIQNFEKLRQEGYYYVDKTALVYRLANTGNYYFLSRPRRFGKSLLLSTLEAYFQGKRDLFEGLAMEELESQWTEYPVIHLDLNAKHYVSEQSLLEILNQYLEIYEALYGDEKKDRSPEERFAYIIRRAYEKTGNRVVILVDEYDKPMLQTIGKPELQEAYRGILKAFYGVLKSMDGHIRFAFLTGVTMFGKVNVFSDLNNLIDLSLRREYVDICGITEQELLDNFEPDIRSLAEAGQMTYEDTLTKLRTDYDGYHFCENSPGLYNPFSLLNTFISNEFGSYWFATGTPTYLVELLRLHHYNLHQLSQEETTAEVLNSVDSLATNPIPVIYQSGYLTIKEYDNEFGIYRLGFPNREVEEGFIKFLLPFYTSVQESKTNFEIGRFVTDVRKGDYDGFLRRLQSLLADTSYEQIKREQEIQYQNVLFIITKLMGFYVKAEYHTSHGRVDLVLQTDRYIYVMEFKLDGTAEEALKQINDKGYALPFVVDGRTLYKIGVNFSSETRNIERWIVEE